MSVERTQRRAGAAHRFAQPVTAVAALLLLFWTLSLPHNFSSVAPLWAIAGSLGLGLAAGPLVQLTGHRAAGTSAEAAQRSVHTVAAVAALLALLWEVLIPRGYFSPISPMAPLWAIAGLLGLGLAADPLVELADGRAAHTSAEAVQRAAQPVAAVAALLALFWALSVPHSFSSMAPLWAIAGFLGLGLVAGPLVQLAGGHAAPESAELVHRAAQPVAVIAALLALFWEMLVSHDYFASNSPMAPLWAIAACLGLGLGAGPLARLASRSRENVLSERVRELSRTRSGALEVQASELRRIERNLHDGAQARLVALSMKLGRAEERYREDSSAAALLREAREDAAAAMRELRELRELARGIAPPVLTDRRLEAAVQFLAQRSGTEVTVSGELVRRPPPAVETAAYFVVAESLTNAAKHAPGARVDVRLADRGSDLIVEVTDFGSGGADPEGEGLTGLRRRVEALDGRFQVTSAASVGTHVEAMLPCGW